MTNEHIEKIKSAVEAADHIPPEKKAELSAVLAKLKPAIANLEQTHAEDAQNISRFVEASAHKAARKEEHLELKTVLGRLKQSVQKFEASHPKLVASVNDYSTVLSSLGV
jgi:predicted amino acid-binding ACT domain protein